jgi:hypothetical protein
MAQYILERMNMNPHRSEVARTCDDWRASLDRRVIDEESFRSLLPDIVSYNEIERGLGAPAWIPNLAELDLDVEQWDLTEQQWLARALILARARPPDDVAVALIHASRRTPASTEDALGMYLIGSLTSTPELQSAALSFVETMRVDNLYRQHAGAPPDLRSTAIGYALNGETSIDAARRFSTDAGFVMASSESSRPEARTVVATFLAFGLATGFDDLATLP